MYHFLNCMLLAFAPHVIIYKATKLAEESGLRACFFGAVGYALTQIIKMFIMASVLPSSAGDDHTQVGAATSVVVKEFALFEELAKTIISLVEVVGVQYTLSNAPNLAKFSRGTRILAIGLGMAFAESVLKYAIPLFWGARGLEFSWSYLEMSLASNVSLLIHLAFVAFVWLRTRTDLNKAVVPMLWTALVGLCALPSIDNYLSLALHIDSWTILAFHAVVAVASVIFAKLLLASYDSQRASSSTAAPKKGQ